MGELLYVDVIILLQSRAKGGGGCVDVIILLQSRAKGGGGGGGGDACAPSVMTLPIHGYPVTPHACSSKHKQCSITKNTMNISFPLSHISLIAISFFLSVNLFLFF